MKIILERRYHYNDVINTPIPLSCEELGHDEASSSPQDFSDCFIAAGYAGDGETASAQGVDHRGSSGLK